jgi:hypothetical protein
MPRKLKVYRTAIGFHDAYVAAPSMKAALEAWGTDKNLFARGVAEQVTDPALTRAALARPGEVVRVPRGSASEHVKALGAMPRRTKAAKAVEQPASAKRAVAPRREKPPKPSRDQLRFAEAALAGAKTRARERLAELAAQERALAAERKRVERQLAAETARFEKRLEQARAQYDKALAAWREG